MNPREQIKAYLDGELSPAEEQAVREAIEADANLKAEVDAFRTIEEAIQAHAVEAPIEGLEETLARIGPKPSPLRWLAPVGGLAAAALAIVLVFPVLGGPEAAMDASLEASESGAASPTGEASAEMQGEESMAEAPPEVADAEGSIEEPEPTAEAPPAAVPQPGRRSFPAPAPRVEMPESSPDPEPLAAQIPPAEPSGGVGGGAASRSGGGASLETEAEAPGMVRSTAEAATDAGADEAAPPTLQLRTEDFVAATERIRSIVEEFEGGRVTQVVPQRLRFQVPPEVVPDLFVRLEELGEVSSPPEVRESIERLAQEAIEDEATSVRFDLELVGPEA